MKLTKLKLEQIIKEELAVYAEAQALVEQEPPRRRPVRPDPEAQKARKQSLAKLRNMPAYERAKLPAGGLGEPHPRRKRSSSPPSFAGKVASTAIGASRPKARHTDMFGQMKKKEKPEDRKEAGQKIIDKIASIEKAKAPKSSKAATGPRGGETPKSIGGLGDKVLAKAAGKKPAPKKRRRPGAPSLEAASEGKGVIRRGHRGPAVKQVQSKLGIKDDGVFGGGTQRAVKAWQKKQGLKPDGVVGYLTGSRMLGKQTLRRKGFSMVQGIEQPPAAPKKPMRPRPSYEKVMP